MRFDSAYLLQCLRCPTKGSFTANLWRLFIRRCAMLVKLKRRPYLVRLYLSYKGWRKYLPPGRALRAAMATSQ